MKPIIIYSFILALVIQSSIAPVNADDMFSRTVNHLFYNQGRLHYYV